MDITSYNRLAWNHQAENKNRWTIPVEAEAITSARQGRWDIFLTPTRSVPQSWFPKELTDTKILCLASGGGQQGPILAAAGAEVVVFDNSPNQLKNDRTISEREHLKLTTVLGDMANLSVFQDLTFDMIVHPIANCFVPNIKIVWNEAYRVLKKGGVLLAGFVNPLVYIFDPFLLEEGTLEAKYTIPYSDLESLSESERNRIIQQRLPLEFSHTLETQIGGQIEAGFHIIGFFEDIDPGKLLANYLPIYIATRAIKP